MKTFKGFVNESKYTFSIPHNKVNKSIFPITPNDNGNFKEMIAGVVNTPGFIEFVTDIINENFGVNLEFETFDKRNSTIDYVPFQNDQIDGIAKHMFSEMQVYLRPYIINDHKTLVIDPHISYNHLGGGSNGSSIFCSQIEIDLTCGNVNIKEFRQ